MKNEETKNPIFKNCRLCMYSDTCEKYEDCEYLSPINDGDYCGELIDQLRADNIPSPDKYMKNIKFDENTTYDGIDSQYEYYRGMINDNLKIIRSGLIAYVYNEKSLKDMLRFEPDLKVVLQGDIFYITL